MECSAVPALTAAQVQSETFRQPGRVTHISRVRPGSSPPRHRETGARPLRPGGALRAAGAQPWPLGRSHPRGCPNVRCHCHTSPGGSAAPGGTTVGGIAGAPDRTEGPRGLLGQLRRRTSGDERKGGPGVGSRLHPQHGYCHSSLHARKQRLREGNEPARPPAHQVPQFPTLSPAGRWLLKGAQRARRWVRFCH